MCACWRMVPVFAVLQICLTRHALRLLWSVHVSCTRRTGSAGLHHFRVMRQSPCTIWRVPPSALGPHNWQPQQQSPSFLTACPCKGSHAALCCPPRARACHQAPEWLAQAACRYTHTRALCTCLSKWQRQLGTVAAPSLLRSPAHMHHMAPCRKPALQQVNTWERIPWPSPDGQTQKSTAQRKQGAQWV